MSVIKKIYNTTETESIDMTSFLTAYNITADDITNAIFVLKDNAYDETYTVEKTISNNGLSLDSQTNILSIFFESSDYGESKLLPNKVYFIALAVEYNVGLGAIRTEVPVKNKLKINPDHITGW